MKYVWLVGALLIGFFIGIFSPRLVGQVKLVVYERKLVNKYPNLSFGLCREAPVIRNCIDAVILDSAVKNGQPNYCLDILSSEAREDCLNRLELISKLKQKKNDLCSTLMNDRVCQDLSATLLAYLEKDFARCGVVTNENFRKSCEEILAPAGPIKQFKVMPANFGLPCDDQDAACFNQKLQFKEAVKKNDITKCDELGGYGQLCRQEAAMYQVFVKNDLSLCPEFINKDFCRRDLFLSQALELRDKTICQRLAIKADRDLCVKAIDTFTEKRFDYLK